MTTTRRNKGEGSITQLSNGKFRVRIETQPVDGKRHWLTATTTTRKEAIKKLQELQRQQEDHKSVQVFRDDLKTYIEPYLSSKESEGMRQSSISVLRYPLQYIGKLLSDIPVHKITKSHIQQYVSSLRSLKITEKTMRQRLNNVKGFLQWLKDDLNIINTNPAASVKIKKTEPIKPHMEILSNDEHKKLKELMEVAFQKFLERHLKTNLYYRMYPLYILTYETGMRQGEVAGLKWENIDFENDTITVNSKVIFIPHLGVIEDVPKSYAGFRTIKVSKTTIELLQTLRDAYKTKYYHSEYVFGNMTRQGRPYAPIALERNFKKYLQEAGVDRNITFHSIRHTNASLMYKYEVSPAIMAKRLGHSSIHTTLTTYTHVFDDDRDLQRVLVEA